MTFTLAECLTCYIVHVDVYEWFANCQSTSVSQLCGNPEQLRLKRGRMVHRSRRQEWMTDLLAVGLLAKHRQMISHLCCKRSSMGSFATATTCTA